MTISKKSRALKWIVAISIFSLTISSLIIRATGMRAIDIKLLPVIPALAGCGNAQRYFVAFTSSAEARALGGLLGQYAIIDINCGSLKIEEVGSNLSLKDSSIFLKAQHDYPDIFLGTNTEWVNSNLFPDGELVASMWIDAFEKQSGTPIDGAIALDIPILVDLALIAGFNFKDKNGTVLSTREKILEYLLNGIYFDYPQDNLKRKEIQLEISKKMATSLSEVTKHKLQVLKILTQALRENRIFIYEPGISNIPFISGHPIFSNVRAQEKTIFIGANNLSGNKFDFYNKFEYSLATCQNFERILKVSIVNNAPRDIKFPSYLVRRLESSPHNTFGSQTQVIAILPKGSAVQSWKGPVDWQAETSVLSNGRLVLNLVGPVDAGKRYTNYVKFKSVGDLRMQQWGSENQAPKFSDSC